MNLIKQKLTPDQEKKIKADLQIIDKLTKVARDNGMRVIVGGGYAVDGFLGEITRSHNDIDIQIYSIEDSPETMIERVLDAITPTEFKYTFKDKGRSEYYHNFLYYFGSSILDIYYIQTKTSPLRKKKYIIKNNGEIAKQEFPEPVFGRISEIAFEIQHPEVELKDKVYKRDVKGDTRRIEHEQDIENLKTKLKQ